MRRLLLAVVVHLALAVAASSLVSLSEQNGVLLLTDAPSFTLALSKYSPLFLLVDSTTRSGSTALFREFADAATSLHSTASSSLPFLRLAAVDVADVKGVVVLPVTGLPALVLFNCLLGQVTIKNSAVVGCDGGISVYSGGRSSAEIQRYLLSVSPTSNASLGKVDQGVLQWVSTRENLMKFISNTALLVLLVVDTVDNSAVADVAAIALTDSIASGASAGIGPAAVRYFASTNATLLDSETERASLPTAVIFREFGRDRLVFPGTSRETSSTSTVGDTTQLSGEYGWNATAFEAYLTKNRFGLVGTYKGGAYASYFYDKTAAGHVLLFANTSASYFLALAPQFDKLADTFAAQNTSNVSVLSIPAAVTSSLVVRFLVVPTENEPELCNAHAVIDPNYIPALLLIGNVSLPAYRFPMAGEVLLAAIDKPDSSSTSPFVKNAASFLNDWLLPVFDPMAPDVADSGMSYDEFWEEGFQRWELGSTDVTVDDSIQISTRRLSVDGFDTGDVYEVSGDDFYYHLLSNQYPQSRAGLIHRITHIDQLQSYKQDGPLVVVFMSPRCSSCRSFEPLFEQLATVFASRYVALSETSEVPVFASVNVDQVDGVATVEGLKSLRRLPGIYVFRKMGTPTSLRPPSLEGWTIEQLVRSVLISIRNG